MVAALLAALLPAMAAGRESRESPEEPLIRGAALNDSHTTASPFTSPSPSQQQQQQQPGDGDGSGPSADGVDRLIEYLPFEDLELGVGNDTEREGGGAADGSHRLLAARILNVHYDDIAKVRLQAGSVFVDYCSLCVCVTVCVCACVDLGSGQAPVFLQELQRDRE